MSGATIQLALDLIKFGMALYQRLKGPPVDLNKLWADAGAEVQRIDKQQDKDEAAENAAAREGGT